RDASLSTGHCLAEAKQQSQIAVNAFPFKSTGGSNSFPGTGDLDQDSFGRDSPFVKHPDQLSSFLDRGILIKTEPRIDFNRDAARDNLQDPLPENDGQL